LGELELLKRRLRQLHQSRRVLSVQLGNRNQAAHGKRQ
jgi:hypothetical protein